MDPPLATVAEYFLLGIESGALPPLAAQEWAYRIVESSPVPLGDVVEVAWSKTTPDLVRALSDVSGYGDRQQAARWVLCAISKQLESQNDAELALRAARHVVLSALGTELQETRSSIEDRLGVAKLGYYSTVEEVVLDLRGFLAKEAATSLPV